VGRGGCRRGGGGPGRGARQKQGGGGGGGAAPRPRPPPLPGEAGGGAPNGAGRGGTPPRRRGGVGRRVLETSGGPAPAPRPTLLPKYVRAAVRAPQMPGPQSTVLRYSSKMRRLPSVRSISTAYSSSRSLRAALRSPPVKSVRASCCVSVLAPRNVCCAGPMGL